MTANGWFQIGFFLVVVRLLLPEAYQQKSDRVERADIVMQSNERRTDLNSTVV